MRKTKQQSPDRLEPGRLYSLFGESVAGAIDFPYQQLQRALPRYIDDAERDFGTEIYDRMLRDPMIAAAVDTLKMRSLKDGLRLSAWDTSGEAAEALKFCEQAIEQLENPLEETLYDMLDGLAYGHKLAELVFEEEEAGKIALRAIKPKPRLNYTFVVDTYENVTGIAAVVPGVTASVPSGVVGAGLKDVLPMDKFWVLRFGQRNGDPRGTSLLRPAYNPWWLKQQTWPQLLKYLSQFAGPSLIGYTPENGPLSTGEMGLTPEDVMLRALKQFQNGSIVVLRGGAKVETIQSQGEGQAFLSAIELYNREITHAILKQTRATMEARYGSKADSETGSDLLDSLVVWIQTSLTKSLRRQVLGRLLTMNFGSASAAFAPRVSLTSANAPSFAAMADAIAKLASSGYLDESQKSGLDAQLGLPAQRVKKEANGDSKTD